MKTYSVGINDYWHTGSIHLEEVPTGLYYLESMTMWICDHIPAIPLPKIKFKVRVRDGWDYTDNKDGWTDLNEWYSDIQQVFHIYICTWVTNFVWKHTKVVNIDLPYKFLQEKFPDKFIDLEREWDEEDIEFRKRQKDFLIGLIVCSEMFIRN